jgi:hypothetical protein
MGIAWGQDSFFIDGVERVVGRMSVRKQWLHSKRLRCYYASMSTVAEIAVALPQLTAKEMVQIERTLHAIHRQRKDEIINDDAYGTLTETDLIASAADAFRACDAEEGHHANPPAR